MKRMREGREIKTLINTVFDGGEGCLDSFNERKREEKEWGRREGVKLLKSEC